jgi:hypothetical protein
MGKRQKHDGRQKRPPSTNPNLKSRTAAAASVKKQKGAKGSTTPINPNHAANPPKPTIPFGMYDRILLVGEGGPQP